MNIDRRQSPYKGRTEPHDPRIDGGKPGKVFRFGFGVALLWRLSESGIAQSITLLPLRHQILPLPYNSSKLADRRWRLVLPVLITAYLTGSPGKSDERDAAIAEAGRIVFGSL